MYATRSSQIGLAFRTNQTAPPQACTLIGAAAMPEIDGDRKHTMRAVPIGAGGSAPDVRQGALGRVDTKDFASYYTLLGGYVYFYSFN
jgi:hypothetical protein